MAYSTTPTYTIRIRPAPHGRAGGRWRATVYKTVGGAVTGVGHAEAGTATEAVKEAKERADNQDRS